MNIVETPFAYSFLGAGIGYAFAGHEQAMALSSGNPIVFGLVSGAAFFAWFYVFNQFILPRLTRK